eukprot:Nk52_evm60s1020 gene=Nk52_evmTU60s1020
MSRNRRRSSRLSEGGEARELLNSYPSVTAEGSVEDNSASLQSEGKSVDCERTPALDRGRFFGVLGRHELCRGLTCIVLLVVLFCVAFILLGWNSVVGAYNHNGGLEHEWKSQWTIIDPTDTSLVTFTGRTKKSEGSSKVGDSLVSYDWPCVMFTFAIDSSVQRAVVQMNGGNCKFRVLRFRRIGAAKETLEKSFTIDSSDKTSVYDLTPDFKGTALREDDVVYRIEVIKLTEASAMSTALKIMTYPKPVHILRIGVEPKDAQFSLESMKARINTAVHHAGNSLARKRRIEFFGDSDTAGFGLHGSPNDSTYTCLREAIRNEDCSLDFPFLLGHHFHADISTVAWSGKGVVKNADVSIFASSSDNMATYWTRTLGYSDIGGDNVWNFSSWVPDAVLVMLGSNDFLIPPSPSEDTFAKAYATLLKRINGSYERPIQIFNVCGGHHVNNEVFCKLINQTVSNLKLSGSANVHYIYISSEGMSKEDDFGCIGHWNANGNRKVASLLAPIIGKTMNWTSGGV